MRLILDFIVSSFHTERRRHFNLPYGMLLTRIFERAQLPIRGHRLDDSRPIATVDTFINQGLKPKDPEKKTKKKKKGSKPSDKKKQKKRSKKSLYPLLKEKLARKEKPPSLKLMMKHLPLLQTS